MADETWRGLEGAWDRLRWARRQRYPDESAKDVAERLGVAAGTYRAYERAPGSSKWIKLDHEHAFHFAKRLRVRWEWLLLGEGEPWLPDADRPPSGKDRAKHLIDQATDEQAEALADMFERLFKTGTNG